MKLENINFPKETRFLVTGGAGFIGSNLVEEILKKGYFVRVLDNFSTGTKENIKHFTKNKNFQLIEGDIRDFETCKKACKNINYVLHQAAWGSVPRSLKMPVKYENINIHGHLNMMQACIESNVKRFIYASSSSVYGDSKDLPKKEGKEGKVISPYALTKKINEEYADLYFRIYGLETIGLRYFNVFGKRQNPNGTYAAVIPKFVKLILENKSPIINGDGENSRDFTYIENVVQANLKACLAPKSSCGKVYNIAYGGRETINSLFNKILNILKKEIKPVYKNERAGDIKHSNADISEAKINLSYNPEYSLDKGLDKAIEWYKNNL